MSAGPGLRASMLAATARSGSKGERNLPIAWLTSCLGERSPDQRSATRATTSCAATPIISTTDPMRTTFGMRWSAVSTLVESGTVVPSSPRMTSARCGGRTTTACSSRISPTSMVSPMSRQAAWSTVASGSTSSDHVTQWQSAQPKQLRSSGFDSPRGPYLLGHWRAGNGTRRNGGRVPGCPPFMQGGPAYSWSPASCRDVAGAIPTPCATWRGSSTVERRPLLGSRKIGRFKSSPRLSTLCTLAGLRAGATYGALVRLHARASLRRSS